MTILKRIVKLIHIRFSASTFCDKIQINQIYFASQNRTDLSFFLIFAHNNTINYEPPVRKSCAK